MSKGRKTKAEVKCHTITSLFKKQLSREWVLCPGCNRNIVKSALDHHLDSECSSFPGAGDSSPHFKHTIVERNTAVVSPEEKTVNCNNSSPELKNRSHDQSSSNETAKKTQKISLSKKLSLKKNISLESTQALSKVKADSGSSRVEKKLKTFNSEIVSEKSFNIDKSTSEVKHRKEITASSNSLRVCNSSVITDYHEINEINLTKVKRQLSFSFTENLSSTSNCNDKEFENNHKEKDDSNKSANTTNVDVLPCKIPFQVQSGYIEKNIDDTIEIKDKNLISEITDVALDIKIENQNEISVTQESVENNNDHSSFQETNSLKMNTAVKISNSNRNADKTKNLFHEQNIKTPEKHVAAFNSNEHTSEKLTPKSSSSSPSSTPKSRKSNANSPGTPKSSPMKQRPYYLENFLLVLKAVTTDPEDSCLFNEVDRQVIEGFFNMSVAAQQLYVRIFQRKHQWIPLTRLDYKEIAEDLLPVLSELCAMGFLENESSLCDLPSVLDLLSLSDLKTLIKTLNIKCNGTQKSQIVEQVLQYSRNQKTVFFGSSKGLSEVILKRARSLLGPSFKITVEPQHLFFRCLILFSLTSYFDENNEANLGQSQLLTLLFVNMGKLTFPQYYVVREKKIFRHREDLIQYETAYRFEQKIMNAIELSKWDEAHDMYLICKEQFQHLLDNPEVSSHIFSLPKFLRRYTAGTVYSRCLTQGVEVLQKQKNYKVAVEQLEKLLEQDIYNKGYRGRWFDRLALNLEQHLKLHEKALSVARKGLEDSNVRIGHRLSLYQRSVRICNSKSHPKLKKVLKEISPVTIAEAPKAYAQGRLFPRNVPGRKSVFISQSQEDAYDGDIVICSVEEVALGHYAQLGYTEGLHGESSTFLTLYGLLFWDIIYQSGYPDVFRSPHQALPLDIYTNEFYELRKEDILERQKRIELATTEELMLIISECWAQNQGATSMVSWNRFENLEQIEDLVSCVGGKLLAGICERFAKDYRHCHSGFPDLVVWNSSTFKIVEVKGPNDRLSPKQMLWLDYLLSIGIDAEVCHVVAVGSRKLKRKFEESSQEDL